MQENFLLQENTTAPPQNVWEYYDYKPERRELYELSKALAELIEKNNFKTVLIMDRSSRPAYIGLFEYWKSKFPNKPKPKIYFVNPKGFISAESLEEDPDRLEQIKLHVTYVKDKEEDTPARPQQAIEQELQTAYKNLMKKKHEPILLFDTCSHSGNTLFPVTETLRNLGFTDIKVCTAEVADRGSRIRSDYHLTDYCHAGCYPFKRDNMVEKSFSHVFSEPTKDTQKRSEARKIRREIQRVVKEGLREDDLEEANVKPGGDGG